MARLRWASGVALGALAVTGCGMGGDGDGDSAPAGDSGGGHVVYATQFAPEAAWALESNDAVMLSRVGCVESLLRYESDGSIQPGLAESYEQADPSTWRFTLREGVEFQDGTPMDADAVVGALTHVLQAPTPARAFNPRFVSGVTAVDETTVEVTTPAPDILLPYRMASPATGILAPKAYAEQQIDIVGTCTGPFTVTEEVARQSLQMEANASYWGGEPALATAEIRFVLDGDARVTQLQSGEAQIIEGIPPAARANLEGDDAVEVLEAQAPRTTSLLVNNSRPPFDNPQVRQALQNAVDLQTIADSVYEGGAVPAIGPFSPDDPWAPADAEPVAVDLDEARRLFSEAGVDPGSLSFELIAYSDRPEFADLAVVIQAQLAELGIDVSVSTGEYVSFEPGLLAGEFDATLLSRSYLVDVGDPAGYLTSDFTCDGTYNIAHYCDPETDAMIQEATATEDADARHQAYAEIAEKLQAEAAGVFLVHNSVLAAVQSGVEGYEIHPVSFYGLTADVSIS